MNKKTACCGCSCLAIIIATIAVVVGGYYGFSFLHSAGKDMAAITFEKTLESVTEKAFNKTDREQILSEVKITAEKIRSGDIGLLKYLQEGSQNLESGLYTKMMLLSFRNHYFLSAEANTEPDSVESNAGKVNRLLLGLNEKRINYSEVASVSSLITEHYQHKVKLDGQDTKTSFSNRRLKTGLGSDEIQKCLIMIEEICNRNEIEAPAYDYTPDIIVKDEILAILKNLQKPQATQK